MSSASYQRTQAGAGQAACSSAGTQTPRTGSFTDRGLLKGHIPARLLEGILRLLPDAAPSYLRSAPDITDSAGLSLRLTLKLLSGGALTLSPAIMLSGLVTGIVCLAPLSSHALKALSEKFFMQQHRGPAAMTAAGLLLQLLEAGTTCRKDSAHGPFLLSPAGAQQIKRDLVNILQAMEPRLFVPWLHPVFTFKELLPECAHRLQEYYRLQEERRQKIRLTELPLSAVLQGEVPPDYMVSEPQQSLRQSDLKAQLEQYTFIGTGYEWSNRHLNTFRALENMRERSTFSQYQRREVLLCLGRDELQHLYVPNASLSTHTMIFGTTGSGKTTLLKLLVCQAILRREPVVILDPKSDYGFLSFIYDLCAQTGRLQDLHILDLAGSLNTTTFNMTGSFDRVTEIAERLTSALPAAGSAVSFRSFAQNALSAAAGLLRLLDIPLTIDTLRLVCARHENFQLLLQDYLEKVCCQLDQEAVWLFLCRRCGDGSAADCRERVLSAWRKAPAGDFLSQLSVQLGDESSLAEKTAEDLLAADSLRSRRMSPQAMASFWHWLCRKGYVKPSGYVQTVLDLLSLSPDYFAKVTAVLKPRLSQLVTEDLQQLLSDAGGRTLRSLLEDNCILYAALSCLKDSTLGSDVGRLIIDDLRSQAGSMNAASDQGLKEKLQRDNRLMSQQDAEEDIFAQYDPEGDDGTQEQAGADSTAADRADTCTAARPRRINVFIDEASEVINESVIQLLNKGRSCGFCLTLATQSYADFEARAGGSDKAGQIVANCNTLMSLRILDMSSARMVSEAFPVTLVEQKSYSASFNEETAGTVSYGGGQNIHTEHNALVPEDLLTCLKDFEYVARLSDGRVVLGQVPLLALQASELQRKEHKATGTAGASASSEHSASQANTAYL